MTDHVCGSSNTAIFRFAQSNPIAWRVFTLLLFSGESSQTADGNKFCRFTRNQVELMQVDNVSSPEMAGFAELGISPDTVEETLLEILRMH